MVDVQSRIEIPIEISATDTREINALLERIERAESKLFKLQAASDDILPEGGGSARDLQNPMSESSHVNKGRKNRRVDTSELTEGRAPIQNGATAEEGENALGSIGLAGAALLSGRAEAAPQGKGTPLGGNLLAGVSPIQRDPAFQKQVQRINDLENKLGGLSAGGGKVLGSTASIFENPVGFVMAIISEAAPIIAPVLIAKGLMDLIISELTKPGAPFDRRFMIRVDKQVATTMDRNTLKQIRAGQVEVRVTTASTLRGNRGNQGNNLSIYTSGRPVYSMDLESLAKGVTP